MIRNLRIFWTGVCMLFVFPVLGQDALERRSIQLTNLEYRSAFLEIERAFGCKIFVHDLPAGLTNVLLADATLHETVSTVLQGTGFDAIILDKIVVVASSGLVGEELTMDYFLAQESIGKTIENSFPVLRVGDSTSVGLQPNYPVRLNVHDEEGVPLESSSVYIDALNASTTTNANGEARLNLPSGKFLVEIRQVGFEPMIFNLVVYSSGRLSLAMVKEIIELEGVVITGEGAEQNVMSSQNVVTISPKQIKEIPVFLGEADVIKTVLTIPGVASIGEGSSGYFVRGGNLDQNLILQDGAVFTNPNHALGFFSVFNPDLIQQVQLYKSNIPAQFGGRLSSVLDVQLKNANNKELKMVGGIGTVMSKLSVEIPLVQDKLSLLVGGRISYSDWMLNFVKDPGVRQSSASFYDFNAKLTQQFSEKANISLGYFQSYDNVIFQDEFGFNWSIKNMTFDWNQQFGSRTFSKFEAVYGSSENNNFDPSGIQAFELRNGQDFLKMKESVSIDLLSHGLVVGGEWIYYNPTDETLENTVTGEMTDRIALDQGHEVSLFANDDWNISDRFALSLGLRYTSFIQTGPGEGIVGQDTVMVTTGEVSRVGHFEPRASLRISTGETSSVKVGYNHLYQYVHLLSNSTGSLPTDKWVVSNYWLQPQESRNYSLGFFKNFDLNQWESSVELFYRSMENIVEYNDFADLVLNPAIDQEVVQGDGEAYGVEVYVKRNRGNVKGSLSYTYSRSFIEAPIHESDEIVRFPAKIDRPNNFNFILDITLSKRSSFGTAFTYTSGRPITVPVTSYSLGDVIVPHYSSRNAERIPAYHRLDISYTYKRNAVKRARFQDRITVGVYNIYGRKNAFSVFFRKDGESPASAYRLSVLGSAFPSITYEFEF